MHATSKLIFDNNLTTITTSTADIILTKDSSFTYINQKIGVMINSGNRPISGERI